LHVQKRASILLFLTIRFWRRPPVTGAVSLAGNAATSRGWSRRQRVRLIVFPDAANTSRPGTF
jgi:hypothetical protein